MYLRTIRMFALASALVILGSQPAMADVLQRLVPNAEVVGKGTFRYFFIDVYDAELFAPDGVFDQDKPHAVRINYLINAYTHRIVSETVKEMKKQGVSIEQIDEWRPEMRSKFINMRRGWYADFILTPDGTLTLAANGEYKNEITDTALAQAIMNLWIGENVSYPKFRRRLLGLPKL